ncbi:MAG: carboxypeptidase regulatory-like domain-containing protein, partial [Planctomycetes bacterium]|nr:carboxypeptidase regulatory-like domain-containing protein [Planctomycetota bacterium]
VEVKLVLAPRPWVKLKVLGKDGQELKNYRISLKRHFPNNPLGIGNVPEFPDRRITMADYPSSLGGEWAAIRGLPSGNTEYRFQIEERNHAKSLSEPFSVKEGDEPTEVIAHLTLGAAITGTVVDDNGTPVSGAIVSTDMNNAFSGAGGIFDIFRQMIPEKHSKLNTRTDSKGRFHLGKLAFAEYMVRVSHADFCEGQSFDITLDQEGQTYDVGIVRLARGAIVEGFTTAQGQALGQVKVTLSVPPEDQPKPAETQPGQPAQPIRMPFSAMTVSDNNGRYTLLKRVPPGRYKIAAARQTGEENPFNILLDMRETEQIITIAPGQDRLKLDFELPTR